MSERMATHHEDTEAKKEQSYNVEEARADYIARMALEGCVPSFPATNELQIDIDTGINYAFFKHSFAIFNRQIREKFGYEPNVVETPSRNGGTHRHIRITLPFDMDDWQRIAWQGALGSDPVRELLSCWRLHNGIEHPTMFIEKLP